MTQKLFIHSSSRASPFKALEGSLLLSCSILEQCSEKSFQNQISQSTSPVNKPYKKTVVGRSKFCKNVEKKVRRFIVKCTVVAKYFTTHKVQSVFNVPRFMVGQVSKVYHQHCHKSKRAFKQKWRECVVTKESMKRRGYFNHRMTKELRNRTQGRRERTTTTEMFSFLSSLFAF